MPHSVSYRRQVRDIAALPVSLAATLLVAALSACGSGSDAGNPTGAGSGGTTATNGSAAQTGTGGKTQTGTGGATNAGSGGSNQAAGSGGMTAAAACTYNQTVIPTTCAQNGCHVPAGFAPDLSTEAMAAAAVSKPIVMPCPGDPTVKYLINPTAPVAGLLIDRISGPLCGLLMQMPFGKPPLTQAEVDCIKSYFMSKIH
jgi:hypothetical protein